jgi:hypothetical protein
VILQSDNNFSYYPEGYLEVKKILSDALNEFALKGKK